MLCWNCPEFWSWAFKKGSQQNLQRLNRFPLVLQEVTVSNSTKLNRRDVIKGLLVSSSPKVMRGFPGGSGSKESAWSAGDLGSIPGLGRSPGGGHGNPLQYSCLENPHRQRSLVGYSPWGGKELDTTEWLSTQHTASYWQLFVIKEKRSWNTNLKVK